MADDAPSRREMLTIKAWDPVTESEIDVYLSYERIRAVASRTIGQIKETQMIVPQVLQDTESAVFEGLCDDADEPRRGVGWRCHCRIPDRSYAPDGTQCPPRNGQVFLVFVNDERVVYNWRWDKADPDRPEMPIGYKTRFTRRLA